MKKGISVDTNYVLDYIGKEKANEIDNYLMEVCSREFVTLQDSEDIANNFSEKINEYISNLNPDELANLKSYTGYEFKNINAILRNKWNYEENGIITDEKKKYMKS